jgi:LPXTG-motif cell wall-anchored protein
LSNSTSTSLSDSLSLSEIPQASESLSETPSVPQETPKAPSAANLPQTGDQAALNSEVLGTALLSSLFLLALYKRRKKQDKKEAEMAN